LAIGYWLFAKRWVLASANLPQILIVVITDTDKLPDRYGPLALF
jgi:hypothetical protein